MVERYSDKYTTHQVLELMAVAIVLGRRPLTLWAPGYVAEWLHRLEHNNAVASLAPAERLELEEWMDEWGPDYFNDDVGGGG